MTLTIAPSPALKGVVSLPGDKSMSHRVALFAALAVGKSRIENFLVAGVTQAMLEALTELGVEWDLEKTNLTVHGKGLHGFRSPNAPLSCGNSATTMRLLAGAIAAAGIPAVLDGSTGLRRRPMGRIVEPLKQMGVQVESTDGNAPLRFTDSAGLKSLNIEMPVASAQVKTCLLLAALAADGPTTLVEPGPSRDHTERLLSSMGVKITRSQIENLKFTATLEPPTMPLSPLRLTLPGDISSAAFLIVAALITPGSEITIKDVGLNPTRTGLLDGLEAMGALIALSNVREIHNEPVGDITVCYSALRGTEIAGPLVVRMIDEFPAFAIAAAYAEGQTTVRDAVELRHKESDRITALCEQLRAVGVGVIETEDGFILEGMTPPRGGIVDPQGDHRLAMSLAVSGLGAQSPVVIQNPRIVHESFPGFKAVLEYLGANID